MVTANIKNVMHAVPVVKKLPLLLNGKISKKIIKKKGIYKAFEFKSYL